MWVAIHSYLNNLCITYLSNHGIELTPTNTPTCSTQKGPDRFTYDDSMRNRFKRNTERSPSASEDTASIYPCKSVPFGLDSKKLDIVLPNVAEEDSDVSDAHVSDESSGGATAWQGMTGVVLRESEAQPEQHIAGEKPNSRCVPHIPTKPRWDRTLDFFHRLLRGLR